MEKTIAIFCSSSEQISQELRQDTRELGRWLGQRNYVIIYGGINKGLMEEVAKGASQDNTTIIGVIPWEASKKGLASSHLTIEIPVADLSQRKEVIIQRASLFVALPGGIGTLDEIFTLLAANQIGEQHKHVILFNPDNSWELLLQLFNQLHQKGYLPHPIPPTLHVASTLPELVSLIEELT